MKGALIVSTLSRCGTFFFGSPSSSAFTQTSVGRFVGPPANGAWSSDHAINRNLIRERQARDFVNEFAFCVPHFDVFRKRLSRGRDMRTVVHTRHENVMAIGRRVD